MASDSKTGVTRLVRFLDEHGHERLGSPLDEKTAEEVDGGLFGPHKLTGKKHTIKSYLSPVSAPPAVLCIGLNYKSHASESQMELPKYPVVFMKNPSSITGHLSTVEIPQCCTYKDQIDYEVELAIVIGKRCKDVSDADALNYVLGYTVGHDVSARDWQLDKVRCGGQWCRGKSFDTFCPLGPCLVLAHAFNPSAVQLTTHVNGELLQNGNTRDLVFSVQQLVSFLSQGTTLLPGTVIMSGTPEGVGFARKPPIWLKDGDEVTVAIDGIGKLTNRIKQL